MSELEFDRMHTRPEVAAMIGVSTKTLREWERTRTGPAVVRFSPKVARYPADAVARFLSDAKESAKTFATPPELAGLRR